MKKELIYVIIMFLICFIGYEFYDIVLVNAQPCMEYKQADKLFIEIVNQTTNQPLANMNCNITFYNLAYSVVFGNVSTTYLDNGLYYWSINSSLANGNYMATAFCSYGIVSSYKFCLVSDYSNNVLSNNMANNFTYSNNQFSQINQTFINSMNQTIQQQFSQINQTLLTNINQTLSQGLTQINSTLITLINAVNQTISEQISDLKDYITGAFWDEVVYLQGITSSKITTLQSELNLWIKGNQTTVDITNYTYVINTSSFNITNTTINDVSLTINNYTVNTTEYPITLYNYTINTTEYPLTLLNYTFNGTTYTIDVYNYTVNTTTETLDINNYTVENPVFNINNYTINETTNSYNLLNYTVNTTAVSISNYTVNVTSNITNTINATLNLILPVSNQ